MKQLAEACERNPNAVGVVQILIEVAPDGTARGVVMATPDVDLGGCVSRAVGKVRFPPTGYGGSFTYPFVFADSTETTGSAGSD